MTAVQTYTTPATSRAPSVGTVTLAGGLTLSAALALNFAMPSFGLDAGWDDPTAFAYYLSNAPLLVGWGLLFVATALALREWRAHGLLWRVGAAWTAVGFGAVTAGFVGVVFASLLGGMPASDLANMVAGMSMMLGVGPGSLLLGAAVARESADATTRYAGAFLALAAATFVGFFLTRGVAPESVALTAFLALPVAWAVYGYARRSTERTVDTVAAPAA
ncbi:hypothetical protein [Halogeometricum luteum]|uniref:DUF998 domain-containing protein n=1 Tax=Halogeometricum luteum TaxID=2950537 RepID=A0ABU2G061_9EURY|nr:hypothetical protein [Halogeometricum sp. S3BR5-2]MDS0294170.1 hypothetical protein [Halogeometricum sp. S3BR5-2]